MTSERTPGDPRGPWSVAGGSVTTLAWELDPGRDRILKLYEAAKTKQWNGRDRLDWSTPVDPENPLGTPADAVPIAGSRTWERLGPSQRSEVIKHLTAWQFSQFLHGEQGGLVCAAKIVQTAPDLDSKLFAATQVVDEARHVEIFTRFIDEKLGIAYPINPCLSLLLETIVTDSRWDMTFLTQVLIEGLSLAAFGIVRDSTTNPLATAITAYVMEDEARHVAFSRLALIDCYRELTDTERAERETFCIEATALMHERFLAHEVWETLELDMADCTDFVLRSPTQQAFRRLLFSRIVPAFKEIGLLGPRMRAHLEALGVLGFETVDLDTTGRADGLAARMADAVRLVQTEANRTDEGEPRVAAPALTSADTLRRTTPADFTALRQFHCSNGAWYEQEVEDLVRGLLALRVAAGFPAWVVESEGEVVAVGAHDGHTHPGDPTKTITYLTVLAGRTSDRDNFVVGAARLSRLLHRMFGEVLASDRAPYCYARVAKDNAAMRTFCERSGFTVGPIPSDPRYLFYITQLVPSPTWVGDPAAG